MLDGAVGGGDRQRAHVFVAHAAAIGGDQQPRHAPRGNSLASRQARPVVEDQLGETELALGKPALDGAAAFAAVAGGGRTVVASVRKSCRAITLFDNLLMSRTAS